MVFMGGNYNRKGVNYKDQPLRGYWYGFLCDTGLLSWWNRLKTRNPEWQVLEFIVRPWDYIYPPEFEDQNG